jgi:tRNA1(Val) A37 N6-methylase TrmN6
VSLAGLPPDTSEDALLGGRVRLRQPRSGYRAAIDPVLLAAAVPATADDTVLDVGCGVGAASLCLAARVPGCRVVGIERHSDLVRLAEDNIALNNLAGRVTAMPGDLLRPPPRLEPGTFAQIMANPPFLAAGRASLSPIPGKAEAAVEGEADLAAWVRFALAMARNRAGITFIHRADRLGHLLAELAERAGDIVVFPLWPGEGKLAKRVIVHARKGSGAPLKLMPGLVLHRQDGRYTDEAEAILRYGVPLNLVF